MISDFDDFSILRIKRKSHGDIVVFVDMTGPHLSIFTLKVLIDLLKRHINGNILSHISL